MMGSGPLQKSIIRMRLRIVLAQSLDTPPELITIPFYGDRQMVINQPLTDDQAEAVIEVEFTGHSRKGGASPHKCQGGMADRREGILDRIDIELVVFNGSQRTAHAATLISPARLGAFFWTRWISFRYCACLDSQVR